MLKITVQPDEVWSYFQKNKSNLEKTEHIIAENDEYGVIISLTSEDDGLPCFVVTADDYQYAEESVISEKDCKETAERLYKDYLTDAFLNREDDEQGRLDQEDMISERELELDDAILAFLEAVAEYDVNMFLGEKTDEICEDLKNHILEYLYRKYGISVRRPMILEDDETGEEFFEEYPYDCIVYDDADNPLYKN